MHAEPAGVVEVKGFTNGINTHLLGLTPSNGDAVHDPICGLLGATHGQRPRWSR